MAKRQYHGVSTEALSSYDRQCAALANDWQRLRQLIDRYRARGADRDQLEDDFLALRSTLACDYPILTYWRKGGYGLSAGINRLMAAAPALGALAETGQADGGRVDQHWRDVWAALQQIAGDLQAARKALGEGRPPQLPSELLEHHGHVPFPIRKVLKAVGIAVSVVLAAGLFYVMRNFLGFWAPEAGAGVVVSEEMSDEDKIHAVLITMNEAFRQNDVDRFMTAIADDFVDEEGNGKTALRVALQAYKESGQFGAVTMDWSRIRILERGGILDVRPVYIVTPEEQITIYLGFKPYGGKFLIATGSSA